tara:strand:+ start:905 stop:1303 length:399 start_codon:yes stop_codon:yes gene_type:complete
MDTINYNYDILCTYHLIEDEEQSNICYRSQLLQVFKLNNYDDNKINSLISNLYNILKDNEEIKEIIDILSNKLVLFQFFRKNNQKIDNVLVFQMLFSYEYFHIFHKLFSKYNTDKSLDKLSFSQLKEFISLN